RVLFRSGRSARCGADRPGGAGRGAVGPRPRGRRGVRAADGAPAGPAAPDLIGARQLPLRRRHRLQAPVRGLETPPSRGSAGPSSPLVPLEVVPDGTCLPGLPGGRPPHPCALVVPPIPSANAGPPLAASWPAFPEAHPLLSRPLRLGGARGLHATFRRNRQ